MSGPAGNALPELHARIAELGSEMSDEVREETLALYRPLHPAVAPQRIIRDVIYGPDERHRLDLHLPLTTPTSPLPVLVFVHGGGFVGGDKGGPTSPFYDNIGRFAVENGFVGATITYRLAPRSPYPAGAEDVARALAWLLVEVNRHGGDPERIVVMGHSAGAAHVATYLALGATRATASPLRGVILSSGIYDPASLIDDTYRSYYNGAAYTADSPSLLTGLVASGVNPLVVVAEYDPPDFHRQAARLIEAYVESEGRLPAVAFGPAHNHYSSPAQYGTIDTGLSSIVAAFLVAAVN